MAVSGRREKIKVASFTQGSDEAYSLVCLPCHRDDTTVPAVGYCIDCQEHLCHVCYTHHKKPTPCRNHRLQDKDDMPSTQQLDTSVHAGSTENLTTPCARHPKEIIKFCCNDHDLLICSICVTLDHNKTCHVDYIPDISDKMIDSHDYKVTMDRMDKLLKKCSSVETKTSEDIKKSNDSLKKALVELTKYRQEVNARIDALQKEVEDKIRAIQHQNDERKITSDTICDDVKKTVKESNDNMNQLNASKQADQLFLEVKQVQKQLQEYENSISSVSADDSINEYKFIPNQVINDALHKEKMFGDILANNQARGKTNTTKRNQPVPTSADGRIYVKTSEDRNNCWITGMTALPPDRLVLVDHSNNCIKLVDVNSKLIIYQLSLGAGRKDEPWDITTTTSTQVAVTVPERQFIQFISVSDKLSKTHTLQTGGHCYGICCHEGKLVVTYKKPGKLEIFDINGRVMTRVAQDSAGKDILTNPLFVLADSSTICISSEGIKHIILFNWQGKIIGRTVDLDFPRGLAMIDDGSLIVSSYGGNKMIQVSEGSINKRFLLEGVRCPLAVCVGNGGRKLYISSTTFSKEDNNILVHNI